MFAAFDIGAALFITFAALYDRFTMTFSLFMALLLIALIFIEISRRAITASTMRASDNENTHR